MQIWSWQDGLEGEGACHLKRFKFQVPYGRRREVTPRKCPPIPICTLWTMAWPHVHKHVHSRSRAPSVHTHRMRNFLKNTKTIANVSYSNFI